jgi:hypothetical protein
MASTDHALSYKQFGQNLDVKDNSQCCHYGDVTTLFITVTQFKCLAYTLASWRLGLSCSLCQWILILMN